LDVFIRFSQFKEDECLFVECMYSIRANYLVYDFLSLGEREKERERERKWESERGEREKKIREKESWQYPPVHNHINGVNAMHQSDTGIS